MTAHRMQLVAKPAATVPAVGVLAINHPAPRVLTPLFQERLAQLNRAERALRALGLRVVWSRIAGPTPQLHFLRDAAVSIAPLMNRMGPRAYHSEDGCTVVSALFEGVTVSWVEPLLTTKPCNFKPTERKNDANEIHR